MKKEVRVSEDIWNQLQTIKQMGKHPHRIYIGRETEYKLREELNAYDLMDYNHIYGVRYFLVNEKDHLDITVLIED